MHWWKHGIGNIASPSDLQMHHHLFFLPLALSKQGEALQELRKCSAKIIVSGMLSSIIQDDGRYGNKVFGTCITMHVPFIGGSLET